jgi:hypothetical protein
MDRYGGQGAIKVGLPTNPEAKSMATFGNTQGKGIDALGYCHGIAAHLIGLCELLMRCPPWMHTWEPVASELLSATAALRSVFCYGLKVEISNGYVDGYRAEEGTFRDPGKCL